MSKGKGTQEKEDVFKALGAWDTWGGAKGAGEAGERGWTQMVKSHEAVRSSMHWNF